MRKAERQSIINIIEGYCDIDQTPADLAKNILSLKISNIWHLSSTIPMTGKSIYTKTRSPSWNHEGSNSVGLTLSTQGQAQTNPA